MHSTVGRWAKRYARSAFNRRLLSGAKWTTFIADEQMKFAHLMKFSHLYIMGNALSFRKEFGLIIVGSLVFTASFLWKDLISEVQEKCFPKDKGLFGRAIYVIIITVVLIMIAVHLRTIFGLNGNNNRVVNLDSDPNNGGSNTGQNDQAIEYTDFFDVDNINGLNEWASLISLPSTSFRCAQLHFASLIRCAQLHFASLIRCAQLHFAALIRFAQLHFASLICCAQLHFAALIRFAHQPLADSLNVV